MITTADLLASLAPNLFQQAYVVDDLPAAAAAMRTTLGCDEFATLPATDLDYDLRGETVSCALELGFARSGDTQIELLRPVRGEGLHVEFLATSGPGLHHLGFMVDDLDAVFVLAADAGHPRLMGGSFGSLRFAYLDTWDTLGVYAEVVEDPDSMMWNLKPWR
jgi:hypothetical protein